MMHAAKEALQRKAEVKFENKGRAIAFPNALVRHCSHFCMHGYLTYSCYHVGTKDLSITLES